MVSDSNLLLQTTSHGSPGLSRRRLSRSTLPKFLPPSHRPSVPTARSRPRITDFKKTKGQQKVWRRSPSENASRCTVSKSNWRAARVTFANYWRKHLVRRREVETRPPSTPPLRSTSPVRLSAAHLGPGVGVVSSKVFRARTAGSGVGNPYRGSRGGRERGRFGTRPLPRPHHPAETCGPRGPVRAWPLARAGCRRLLPSPTLP